MRIFLIILLLGTSLLSHAQASDDSTLQIEYAVAEDVLDYSTFMALVREHHPLARNADMQVEMGNAELRAKRGGFDPKLYADVTQKYFDEIQYYSYQEGGIVVPTWMGIEFEGGYSNNDGTYLNNQATVPDDGLWWAGLSVPIGRDLFIDSRRAALRQAQIYQKATEAERVLMLNDLLLKAGETYWKWFSAYNEFLVYEESVAIVQQRFENTRIGARLGDQADIDTVESRIQLFNRKAQYQESFAKYQNSRVLLSTFLWNEGTIPLVIRGDVKPTDIESITPRESSEIYRDTVLNNHPLLQFNQAKVDQIDIDRRLKAEQIKPKLDLKYRALQRTTTSGREGTGILEDDYIWGLSFSFPVFIRKERGELQKMKIKLQQMQFEFNNKRQKLQFEIRAAINNWNASSQKATLYDDASVDSRRLLEAEQQLFTIGESSVFMINARELNYIKAQLNWIKSLEENRVSELKTYYKLGTLSNR